MYSICEFFVNNQNIKKSILTFLSTSGIIKNTPNKQLTFHAREFLQLNMVSSSNAVEFFSAVDKHMLYIFLPSLITAMALLHTGTSIPDARNVV